MIELAGAIRFAHLASVVLLAGSYVFVLFVAAPAFRADGGGDAAIFLRRQLRRITWVCLIVAILSALAALMLQASVVGGGLPGPAAPQASSPGLATVIVPLLTETLYGRVWLIRMLLAGLLAAVLLLDARGQRPALDAGLAGLILSALLLASIALSGHAAAADGAELLLHIVADASHLLAAGAWLGALPGLVMLLRRCAPEGCVTGSGVMENSVIESGATHSLFTDGRTAQYAVIREATRRFSRLGMICVSTLLVTGAINTWLLVGGVPQLVGTPYGQLLLLKLSLLLPMLGIAAINLLRINPAIAATDVQAPGVPAPALARKLARNALIEAALGFMILAIVGILGATPPARHMEPDWPFPFRWDWASLDAAPKARAEVEIGLAWGLLGLFVLQFAFLSRNLRAWTAGIGIALLIYAGVAVLTPVSTDAFPTTYQRPAVAYQAISVANGRELYASHCSSCHGGRGHGDGPAAEALRPRPADLTARHANAHTAGDLFWWVSKGIPDTAMQGFGASLSEVERWDLINFVRALATARRARNLAPVIEAGPSLVAPDFSYTTSNREGRALKDHRGERVVLLVLGDAKSSAARFALLEAAAAQLGSAGVDIIAVPRDPQGTAAARAAQVIEGNGEIHATYALFAGSFSEEPSEQTAGAATPHVEFLIDRQGYIRARWLPAESQAWRDPAAIMKQAELLLKETPRAPAPEEHVH